MKALVLGSGRMAAIRASALRKLDDVQLVFARREAARGESIAATFGGTDVPMAAALETAPDMVFVTSATAHHQADVELALAAGVPVLVEKPLAAGIAESEALAKAAADLGVPLVVGFHRRFDRGFLGLKQAIDSGEVGTLYVMRSASMDHTPGRPEFIVASAGIFHDLFVHDIETAMWLTGQRVESVYATGDSRVSSAYAEHGDADVATIIARLTDGLTVTMHGVRHEPLGQDVRWEVYGSQLALSAGLSRRTPVLAVDEPGLTNSGAPLTFAERFADAFVEETRSFVHSCASGAPFLGCTAHEAVLVSRVADACTRSRAAGRAVRVDD